ncbi:MAG: hypothetical protein J6K85_03485 [Clostridia bacterium]|nr:hypothetical protein [Clostridia bacterium]
MKIDLLHNKIVAETLTPAFEASVRGNLASLLDEIYSEGEIVGIQMYEDYISDDFSLNGYWYYPLTVITRSGYDTVWIKWALTEGDFKNGVPYSYVGEGELEFALAADTPDAFAHCLEGRALYCEDGLIRVDVRSGTDVVKLSGRYSQTFLDELSRQITPAIEAAASVEGIADSPIGLIISFAPNTYMDHISDNVTYRRLTMVDNASAPRDFWVKWTRLDGAVAYHASEHVWGDHIFFELGEDVAQKIIEKEYRYLLTAAGEKYHSAMSRSNVTAWRDLIKRAVKYGEITKVEREIELEPATLALEEQLANVLSRAGISAPDRKAEPEAASSFDGDDDFSRAMRKVLEVAGNNDDYEAAPEPEWLEAEDEAEEIELLDDDGFPEIEDEPDIELEEIEEIEEILEIDEPIEDTEEEMIEEIEEIDEDAAALDELTRLALEALSEAKNAPAEPEESDIEFEVLPISDEVAEEIGAVPVEESEEESIDEQEEPAPLDIVDEPVEEIPVAPIIDEESIRAEIEAKIRLEYENRARIKAEEEIAKLRREQEQLRLENEALAARAEREKEALRAEYEKLKEKARREALASEARDAVRRAEEEKLRAQIENRLRHEARERERLAEAARMAIEEQRRAEAEVARAAYLREEEERERIANERRAAEEARIEEMKRTELERIRREEEERQRAVREAMPEMGDGKYTYTNRNVRLIFRRSVDPNITSRIHEIMKASIEYYGKEKIYLKIRASIPDSQTVCLEFIHIPMEEMELLGNIIKILGNSGLGIAKAIIE